MKQKAFTLAEVMIVLTVIGIISAIIMPIARQSIPDKNVMLFKKGHNTVYQVISELINSDKYYKDGDFGIKPDGTLINGDHTGDQSYFCNTFVDVITTKSANCSNTIEGASTTNYLGSIVCSDWDFADSRKEYGQAGWLDIFCKNNVQLGEQIISSDGIIFYETFNHITFGNDKYTGSISRLFLTEVRNYLTLYPIPEMESAYRCKKVLCMDIDGIGKGEDPFGYGIRVDGKIINGKRATEWLEKELNNE